MNFGYCIRKENWIGIKPSRLNAICISRSSTLSKLYLYIPPYEGWKLRYQIPQCLVERIRLQTSCCFLMIRCIEMNYCFEVLKCKISGKTDILQAVSSGHSACRLRNQYNRCTSPSGDNRSRFLQLTRIRLGMGEQTRWRAPWNRKYLARKLLKTWRRRLSNYGGSCWKTEVNSTMPIVSENLYLSFFLTNFILQILCNYDLKFPLNPVQSMALYGLYFALPWYCDLRVEGLVVIRL